LNEQSKLFYSGTLSYQGNQKQHTLIVNLLCAQMQKMTMFRFFGLIIA